MFVVEMLSIRNTFVARKPSLYDIPKNRCTDDAL